MYISGMVLIKEGRSLRAGRLCLDKVESDAKEDQQEVESKYSVPTSVAVSRGTWKPCVGRNWSSLPILVVALSNPG